MRILFTLTLLVYVVTAARSQSKSEIAFTIPGKDLIPEGITVDPSTGDFYVSSIYKNKIVKYSKGITTDFIKTDQDGFMGGIGLHVDAKRNVLWACSGNIMGNKFRRGIFAYDLITGKLLEKVVFPTDTAKRFFNDLVIHNDGNIYITDTFDHSVWKWGRATGSREPVKLPLKGTVKWPNGIVLSPDNKFLFVATAEGIKRITIDTNEVKLLSMPAGALPSFGLDGLEFYDNSIVGVQNEYTSNREMKLMRYFLNKELDGISRAEVMDTGNTFFDVPTTLAIYNNVVYVLANSQMNNLDQEKLTLKEPEKLTVTYILKYVLH